MYEIAKKAREKMKAKARSLAGEKDQKTDSSDWSPAEPLNADAKTGMRPISPRNFKKGGKVVGKVSGAASNPRADRKARKSGGRVESEIGVGMANKNMKEANQSREGVKHIGGLKKGGKVARKDGGNVPSDKETMTNKDRIGTEKIKPVRGAAQHYKKGGACGKADGGGKLPSPEEALGSEVRMKGLKVMPSQANSAAAEVTPAQLKREEGYTQADMKAKRKSGGRAKKMDGGTLVMDELARRNPPNRNVIDAAIKAQSDASQYAPSSVGMSASQQAPMSEAMKAMGRKSGGRTKKMDGGVMVAPVNVPRGRMSFGQNVVTPGLKKGGKAEGGEKWIQKAIEKPGALRKSLGVKEGEKIPAKKLHEAAEKGGKLGKRARLAETLGRMNRKSGGRTGNGKTNIKIVIAPGQRAPQAGMTGPGAPPPAGLPGSPGGPIPVPAPAPGAGAPPVMPPQMPMPAPAGAPPMMRKSGGRISKVAKSYKDMTAGSGSGEGRLQKTDIAKLHKDAPARKSGGRAKSYKDMTAGAGSGEGRMQKTEIEKSQRLRGK